MVSAPKQRGHFCRTSSAELLARGLIANSEPGRLESSEMVLVLVYNGCVISFMSETPVLSSSVNWRQIDPQPYGSSLCPTRPPAVRGVLRRLTEKVQRVAAKG